MISQFRQGIIFATIGTACFSMKAVFIKLAYAYDVSAISLLTLRMLMALPFFLIAIYWAESKAKTRLTAKDFSIILIASFLGYYLASVLDFVGLQWIDATLERMILYTFPGFVIAIAVLRGKKSFSKGLAIGSVITYVGLIVILGSNGITISEGTFKGGLFVLASALSYALYLTLAGDSIPKIGAMRFNAYAMTASCLIVLAHFGVTEDIGTMHHFDSAVWFYGFLIATISTVIPSFMVMAGISKIGASHTAVLGMLGPLFTFAASAFLLDESLNLLQIFGGILIIGGIYIVSKFK